MLYDSIESSYAALAYKSVTKSIRKELTPLLRTLLKLNFNKSLFLVWLHGHPDIDKDKAFAPIELTIVIITSAELCRHLELASDLVRCDYVWSQIMKHNIIGAKHQIGREIPKAALAASEEITAKNGLTWKFVSSTRLYFSRFWESAVKLVKWQTKSAPITAWIL